MYKLSIKTRKLRGSDLKQAIAHNSRKTNAKSVISNKSKLNIHQRSPYFTENKIKTNDDLWNLIRADFLKKKKAGFRLGRFLKRVSVKKTQSKDGVKKYTRIDTSIAREFIIQIGNLTNVYTGDNLKEIYKKIAKFILQKYKLNVIYFDIHFDESVPHAHLLATLYDFDTGIFSKKLNISNSYEILQKECYNFVNNSIMRIEPYTKKTTKDRDYVNPQEWNRKCEAIKQMKGLSLHEHIKQMEQLMSEIKHYVDFINELYMFELKNKKSILAKIAFDEAHLTRRL